MLTDLEKNQIEKLLTSEDFDWHFNISTIHGRKSNYKNEYDSIQLTHLFVYKGNLFTSQENLNVLQPLLDQIDYKEIYKIKANMLFPTNVSGEYHIPHFDHEDSEYKTLLYYVNDSDGETVIFDKYQHESVDDIKVVQRVSPAKGKAILFDSARYHSSNNPVNSKYRVVLNIIYR